MTTASGWPARIGPYRVGDRLGAGGMGVVYGAVDADGRPVAVKVLRAALSSPDLQRRFAREARIRIEHPNVVRVLDAGTDADGAPFGVLERLEGEHA